MATTWNVPGDASTIQGGIDLATAGDTVLVACGTYEESGIYIGSSADGITLRSETGEPDCVTINAMQMDRAVYCSSIGSSTSIEGFTITGGESNNGSAFFLEGSDPKITSCVMVDNYSYGVGGAVYCSSASPVFQDCSFYDNHGSTAGALSCHSSGADSVILDNCIVERNDNGALNFENTPPILRNCRIADNISNAIVYTSYYVTEISAVISNCMILENGGNGIEITRYQGTSTDSIINCVIAGNGSRGITQSGSDNYPGIAIRRSTIAFNGNSGILSMSQIELSNCILAFNSAQAFDRASYEPNPIVNCSDVFGNIGGDYVGLLEGLNGLNGNFSEDPMFCDRSAMDYHLATASPCVGAAGCGLVGALGEGCSEPASPRIWHVPSEAPSIQAGIDSCKIGESVEVECGTYYEHDLSLKSGMELRSETGIADCVTIDADHQGHVIYADAVHGATVKGMTITGGNASYGGGFYGISTSDCSIVNCVFHSNEAGNGAAICGARRISHSTLVNNTCGASGGVIHMDIYSNPESLIVSNSIIAFSDQGSAFGFNGNPTLFSISCSDLFGNAGGDWISEIAEFEGVDGNFSLDPLFCNEPHLNLYLAAISPCLDAPGCGPIGALGQGCDEPDPPMVWVVPVDAPTIQAAIDSAVAGEIVEISCGTYTWSSEGTASGGALIHMKSGVTLRGETGSPDCVTIDGEYQGIVFQLDNCLPNTEVEGIRIIGGQSAGMKFTESPISVSNCIFEANNGAGIEVRLLAGAVTLTDCLFKENGTAIESYGNWHDSVNGPLVYYSDFIGNDLALHYEYSGGGDFDHCLFYDNGNFAWTFEASISFHYSNIAFNGNTGDPSLSLSCSNLYSGSRSNSNPNDVFDRADGNVSTDPMFCDPENGDFTLARETPLLGGSCVQIGPYGLGDCDWGIISVTDIPDDQGRQVRLRWEHAWHDDFTTDIDVTQYGIWRRIDPGGRGRVRNSEMARQLPLRDLPPGEWDGVTTIPAMAWESYSAVVSTLCDSTISEGQCLSVFFVTAHSTDPSHYFYCFPDSGYSLDNLIPSVPQNLRFEEENLLAWDACQDDDFRNFSVFASSIDSLDESAELLDHTTETSFDVDDLGQTYFHVTASDFAGNESAASSIENEVTGVEDLPLPTSYTLYANAPNPFNPSTTFHFDLPEPAQVKLKIYDISGSLVHELLNCEMPAGRHRLAWQGRNSKGRRLASGVYFFSLEAGPFSQTRKMTLLK